MSSAIDDWSSFIRAIIRTIMRLVSSGSWRLLMLLGLLNLHSCYVSGQDQNSQAQQNTSTPKTSEDDSGTAKRLTLGPNEGRILQRVPPVYPAEARRKHIEGPVLLDVIVGTDGTIKSVKPISGDPALVKAAIDAVKQWRYSPMQLEGKPVEVSTKVTINFTLQR